MTIYKTVENICCVLFHISGRFATRQPDSGRRAFVLGQRENAVHH